MHKPSRVRAAFPSRPFRNLARAPFAWRPETEGRDREGNRPRWLRDLRSETEETRKGGILQVVRFDSFSILCASYWTNRLHGGSARQNPSWLRAGTAVYQPIPERCTQYRTVCFGRLSKAQVTVAQADRRSSKDAEKADGRQRTVTIRIRGSGKGRGDAAAGSPPRRRNTSDRTAPCHASRVTSAVRDDFADLVVALLGLGHEGEGPGAVAGAEQVALPRDQLV